ncbi:hypothetical protein DFQ27_005757 [Actinomortierella ambigua]|uniref:DUF1168-domain-containing protein n=1 Tax=Actinomortierella ambigua TaxID=1343610 RepID=A0A9P6Q0M0_9FUNG|nr:hypothetical protein DFQ27_005757 [Actinomortierella ambigua]
MSKHQRDDDDTAGASTVKKHHFEPIELQKMQLEKLMAKADKPVHIPERAQKRVTDPQNVKNYIKNIQGSSAGAGSGEFHVYRAVRRREYTRLKNMELESKEEREKREFEEKVEAKRREDEERTEKNRAKRQKRKQRSKKKKGGGKPQQGDDEDSDSGDGENEKSDSESKVKQDA